MKYTINIESPDHVAGITAARAMKNSEIPETRTIDGKEVPREKHPDFISTDEAYLQFVMVSAAKSYATQYKTEKA